MFRLEAASIGETLARGIYRALAQLPAGGGLASRVLTPGAGVAERVEAVRIPLDGQEMPGRFFEPRRPTGAVVLLVHGALTHDLPPYAHFLEAILSRGFGVLAIEMDGHGGNPRPFRAEGLAQNVPAALRYLQARPGIDPGRIGVLGFSLGGVCALQALPAFPEVRALVTVATPISVAVDGARHLAEVATLVSPGGVVMLGEFSPRELFAFLDTSFRVAGPDGRIRELHCLDHRTSRAVSGAVVHMEPLKHLEQLPDLPYMQVHGMWDNIIPPAHARALHARAGGPKALELAPMRNHFTIMGCPRAVSATAGWLERWV